MTGASKSVFVSDERRAWMRLRSHTVVFEDDPEFGRYIHDRSGSLMTVVRIWVADAKDPALIRHYVGSVRHCDCGGWLGRRELHRLFRQATLTARSVGENARDFRGRLSRFLRESFE